VGSGGVEGGGLKVVPPNASLIPYIASSQVYYIFCQCQLLLQYYSIKEGEITSYIVRQADGLARLERERETEEGRDILASTTCCYYYYCYSVAASSLLDGVRL
jgi:hypothetical protein